MTSFIPAIIVDAPRMRLNSVLTDEWIFCGRESRFCGANWNDEAVSRKYPRIINNACDMDMDMDMLRTKALDFLIGIRWNWR